VPWAPSWQEYNYFSQILDFKLYSHWHRLTKRLFGLVVKIVQGIHTTSLARPCHQLVVRYVVFAQIPQYVNDTETLTLLAGKLYFMNVFSRRKSHDIFQGLDQGGELVTGHCGTERLNTEIDEVLLAKASVVEEFTGITFVRGKHN